VVAALEKRIVNSGSRDVPADMLLVQERKRRLNATASPSAPTAPPPAPNVEEILVTDEDQLLETITFHEVVAGTGEVRLHRPLSQVTLMQMGWSGPIDHVALQAALACYVVGGTPDSDMLATLGGRSPWREQDEASFLVCLRPQEIAVVRRLCQLDHSTLGAPFVAAARLPDRITGGESSTTVVVNSILAAYRRASIAHSWHSALASSESVQLHRERDEAAVAVLSTVRALLGER
jgi:hypothetical protein